MAVRIESHAEPITGYRLIDRLGSGGFGEVWKAEAPGGIFKAIKIIHGDLRNRETDTYRFAEQELKALKRVKQVRHPYLLALDRYDIVDGRLMITMELADCNLWDRFRECRKQGHVGIPRDELLRYMSETAEVLDLFNDQFQLQHLDIKPQNLFLLHQHVKVADFGQVKDLEGLMAQVTGGITPVYAAPETFDGFVSRFCDQYSLACVYQELLTGARPFDGTSMQQLLMQHLQMPPNLAPSPPGDRAPLARALAKKPEDRFPSVMAMVSALAAAGTALPRSAGQSPPPAAPPPSPFDAKPRAADPSLSGAIHVYPTSPPGGNSPVIVGDLLRGPDSTPPPRGTDTLPPPARPVPAERAGPGPLRPALIVGLGHTGLRVLQRLRKQLDDRWGDAKLPAVRTVYVDTDPDAAAAAAADQPWAGLAPLRDADVLATPLQRAGHYLKPRFNGRSLIEGWFDPALLYKLPRNPVTMGLRVFGRLAFCDHYRSLSAKLQAELDACLAPAALDDTAAATGLDVRTNRPRVYVVAGLGGGTGSGMFLDAAYVLRARLRRLGYVDPEVVGVLLLPPDGTPGDVTSQAQANTYAALTELHHYARPGTVFAANYDERGGAVRDPEPPFTQVFLAPGLGYQPADGGRGASGVIGATQFNRAASGAVRQPPPRASGAVGRPTGGSRVVVGAVRPGFGDEEPAGKDPTAAAAEFLRLDLFTPVGRLADGGRRRPDDPDEAAGTVRTFGVARYSWPRAEVVARAARVMAPVLMAHWVSPDPTYIRSVIPGWAAELWDRLGLDPEKLLGRLNGEAEQAVGGTVAQLAAATVDPLVPRGWMARLPDPDRVSLAVNQVVEAIGRPGQLANQTPSAFEEALAAAVAPAVALALNDLTALFPGLVEAPTFRLAGTEEAIRHVLTLLDRGRLGVEGEVQEREAASAAAYDLLMAHAHYQKGMRKSTAAELTDALTGYPRARHRELVLRAVLCVFRPVREFLTNALTEVSACRQKVDLFRPLVQAEAEVPAAPPGVDDLLPPGCPGTEDAAQVFLRSLTDDDLTALDAHVQGRLEEACGGLYQACLNSADGPGGLVHVLRDATRAYLDGRVGEVDLAAMFVTKFGGAGGAGRALARAYELATPGLVGNGPWARTGVGVFAAPAGAGGDPIREVAADTLPAKTPTADVPDEVAVYREFPDVPLVALPQLGTQWANAYRAAAEAQQATPHIRVDVTKWIDVDGG